MALKFPVAFGMNLLSDIGTGFRPRETTERRRDHGLRAQELRVGARKNGG